MIRNIAFTAIIAAILAVCFSFTGCKQQAPTSTVKTTPVAYKHYVLQTEPSEPISVLDFKTQAKSGESITVVGRIGGGIQPWINGRAAFVLVDTDAAMPCDDEHCDACAKEIAESSTVVKFVDEKGKTLPVDSRDLLGVKEEDTVVVKGVAKRDDDGNVALLATGIYIQPFTSSK